MFNQKLSNKGFSMLIVILLAVLTLSILGGVYYFFFYSKGKPINLSVNNTINEQTNVDCSKESDINGCESLKLLNNARNERGLSPIIKDEKLCMLAKDISDSLIKADNSKESYNLDVYLQNLINDKKYDYFTRNREKSTYQVNFYEGVSKYEAWQFKYSYGLGRYDMGCIVYSELNNKGFWRVVLFLDSGAGN